MITNVHKVEHTIDQWTGESFTTRPWKIPTAGAINAPWKGCYATPSTALAGLNEWCNEQLEITKKKKEELEKKKEELEKKNGEKTTGDLADEFNFVPFTTEHAHQLVDQFDASIRVNEHLSDDIPTIPDGYVLKPAPNYRQLKEFKGTQSLDEFHSEYDHDLQLWWYVQELPKIPSTVKLPYSWNQAILKNGSLKYEPLTTVRGAKAIIKFLRQYIGTEGSAIIYLSKKNPVSAMGIQARKEGLTSKPVHLEDAIKHLRENPDDPRFFEQEITVIAKKPLTFGKEDDAAAAEPERDDDSSDEESEAEAGEEEEEEKRPRKKRTKKDDDEEKPKKARNPRDPKEKKAKAKATPPKVTKSKVTKEKQVVKTRKTKKVADETKGNWMAELVH